MANPKKKIFLGFSFPPKIFKFQRIFQIQLRFQKGGGEVFKNS